MDLAKLLQEAQEAGLPMAPRLAEIQGYPAPLQEYWVRDVLMYHVREWDFRDPDVQSVWGQEIALLRAHGVIPLTQADEVAYHQEHEAYMRATYLQRKARV